MNILVTGANGLLGRTLCYLLAEDHKIFALIRDHEQFLLNLNHKNISPVIGDLSHFETIELPEEIDAVYYLAQSRKFRSIPEGNLDVFAINTQGPLCLAHWAMKNEITHYFYASSGGIYPPSGEPITEDTPIHLQKSRGFYLDSKLGAELLLENYSSYFKTFSIIRPFFIYGIGQEQNMLIPRLINSVKTGSDITLSHDDGIRINPINVQDAAKACAQLLKIRGRYTFNIAGNEIITIGQIVRIIGLLVQKEPRFILTPTKQPDLIGDITQMKKLLYGPNISLYEGLKEMIGVEN
jgi:nucleoside-diphosphate-sugar epimerase